ncbi:DUF4231 domain-containing protein [Streptomyces tirandamycinicus]|uniref:DUF4231 domain-containing protein n=1 Tax=Streptomyces tirandamycinicus TaxID=2174846 RepID=UPI0034461478
MSDPTPSGDREPMEGATPYAQWVFDTLRYVERGGRRLEHKDAFEPYPDATIDWTDVKRFIDAATHAEVQWLAPWSIHPFKDDPTKALVSYKHNDGGESIWQSVHIHDHYAPSPDLTWGDVVSQTLKSTSDLYHLAFPDIRRSPRGLVTTATPIQHPCTDIEESDEMASEEEQPHARAERDESESGSNGERSALRVRQRRGEPYSLSDLDSNYEPWVYEIIVCLEYGGRGLSVDDASLPFPERLNWAHVRSFLEAGWEADITRLLLWEVFPDNEDLSSALVWHNESDTSGAFWSSISIVDLVPEGSLPEGSVTWGSAIEACISGLEGFSRPPTVRYVPPAPPLEGENETLSKEGIQALIDAALKKAYTQGGEQGTANTGGFLPADEVAADDHVARTLSHRRQAAALISQIRLSRMSRFLVIGSSVISFSLTFILALANAITWRRADMLPYNTASGVLFLLLLLVFAYGRHMNTGQPQEHESKSVAELRLELDLLEERRILEASSGARSSRDRQHSYRETIPQEIDRLRRETRRYRRVHNFFQWSLFVASVTMSVTAAIYDPPQPGKAILIGLGAFVSFTTAVTGYFKYRERAFNLQQTADAIEQHVTAYDLAIAPYNQAQEAANLERLAENVETLRVEQRKREQQLEQPHQGQQEVI